MRRVVVTGLGAVTPLGLGVRNSWKRLLDGKCGILNITDNYGKFNELPSRVAASVPLGTASEGGWNAKEWLAPGDERRMALFSQYAIAAGEEALADAGWKPKSDQERERTGVCVGSGIGNFDDIFGTSITYKKNGYKKVSALFVPRILMNLAAGHIAMRYGFKGPNHTVSTACTTGAHSIGDASRFIQFGDAEVMLAGGTESCIHPLALAGFGRAKCLATAWEDTPHLSSRPFDRDRNGFVMGEGAGMMVLEELEHARHRGARVYAEMSGYGLSADAHHITAPPENGEGALLAMKRALAHARIEPTKVDYVNAHATSTPQGDAAENRAIKRLFDGARSPHDINISSSKGAIGHLLGAAGAVEAIFTILTVYENTLPPTLNLENPGDPEEEFNCNYVPKVPQFRTVNAALTNSFGFGGTNASLCFSKVG